MEWKSLTLFLFLGLASAQNYNYADLYEIPGADFVGFGYDSRFIEPVQAARLPLFEWNFDEVKTYRYPAHKQYRFRVPDEMFVRTVARTDAANYVFQNTNEMQQRLAFDAGVSFLRNKTGATTDDMSPPDRAALIEQLRANATGSTNATAGDISLEEAGYGNGEFLPTTERSTGSRIFSIGAEFSFLRNNVDQQDNWITQNEQLTKYYQLFLNKRKLRQEFLDDVARLKGESYFGPNRDLYVNFFEKYGTHVVVSAMMGGAISMTSVVQRTAATDTDTISLGVTVQFNQSDNTATNETQVEEIIENSPECTGDEAGWSYYTLSKECKAPFALKCNTPMEFQESFEANEPTGEWTFHSGPNRLKISSFDEECKRFKLCPNFNNWVLSRQNNNEYRNGLNWLIRNSGSKWTFYHWNWFWIYSQEYQKVAKCPKGHSNNFIGETCAAVNVKFFRGPQINITSDNSACSSCGSHLTIDSQTQQFQTPSNEYGQRGRVIRLKNSANPNLFQFYVRSNFDASGNHNVIELLESTDVYNRTFAKFFFAPNKKYGLATSANGGLANGALDYQAGATNWIKVGLEINWEASTVTHWAYDDDSDDLPRKGATVPFFQPATALNMMFLYNHHQRSSGSWDEFKFCNPSGAPKFVPVTRASAVTTSSARFKQTLNGHIDFDYANTFSSFTFSQSSNYRLKGGDSSQVDLLDLRKKYSTFETWKGTIIENPAPISFVLKRIDEMVPDLEQRPLIKEAIEDWTNTEDITSIIVDDSPDVSRMESEEED